MAQDRIKEFYRYWMLFSRHHHPDLLLHNMCRVRPRKALLSLSSLMSNSGRQLLFWTQPGEAVLLAFDSSHNRLWLSMTGWRRVLSRPQWSSPALSSPQLRLTPSCLTAAVSGVAAAENLRTSEPQSSESLKLPINPHATSLYFTARHSSMAQILGK